MNYKTYRFDKPFVTEQGGVIEDFTIAYHTWGHLNAAGDNVVWVCHALTANSDVADWWQGTIEPGKFLDPERWYVVCANIPGSCYGSTGPLSINPATGEPYYSDFPALTMRDIVRVLDAFATAIGVGRINTIVGSSVGGFQALEWAAAAPERFERMVLIATAAYATPWAIALDETQRMAIRADGSWGERRADAASAGLAAARAIGLLSYRGGPAYNRTQADAPSTEPAPQRRACSYQRHQGDKLVRRFNAYSYMSILDAFDTHDIGRDRGGVEAALATIAAETIVIGITTDIIFPPDEMRALADALPHARYAEIYSDMGHDGFLVENRQLNDILIPFMNETTR
ncbi:MAG: homoserine O-acetyltransferase [Muribaculaceae bacterium]